MREKLAEMQAAETKRLAVLRAQRDYRLDELASILAAALCESMRREGLTLLQALERIGQEDLPNEGDAHPFLALLAARLAARGVATAPEQLLREEERGDEGARIAYLQNRYTEHAYGIFAPALKKPTVSYCESFAASCAAVSDGLADLCILPLRGEDGAYLHAFLSLIEGYGLSVRAVCAVESEPGEDAVTEYALCGRGLFVPSQAPFTRLELLLPSMCEQSTAQFLTFIAALGGGVLVAELLPSRHAAGRSLRLGATVPHGALFLLLLYARLFAADALLYGVCAAEKADTAEE